MNKGVLVNTQDSFSIDIVLRHPSYSPEAISKALAIEPQSSWAACQSPDAQRAKQAYFHSRLQKGNSSSDYETALGDVVLFLEKNATFWTEFISGQGEVEIILNLTLLQGVDQDDLCLKLRLAPRFLAQLSNRGIALRVQGWKGAGGA